MMSCALINHPTPVASSDICYLYNKNDFIYHVTDNEDTKAKLRTDYAIWKSQGCGSVVPK